MSTKDITIDKDLLSILLDEQMETFQLKDLLEFYCQEYLPSPTRVNRNRARQWLSSQVKRLCKLGLLETVENDSSKQNVFQRTDRFNTAPFSPMTSSLKHKEDFQGVDDISDEYGEQDSDSNNLIHKLKERALQYQVDLMTTIAESEEYKRLYADFPTLKMELEPEYHKARERSSKLLGQLKAIEFIISRCT